ncbi:hypothetical protein [Leptothrix discophora]|uniref:Uncharacterized protein n=1 Tax=Leptothrix discophora TaxID=89 RepID=A0ABT9G1K8_LEPDI|nr:hypothetical protein [Leptothrix discophora]MDP4300374.1 hypothetical protein [Leptothrix discophora]
MSLPLHIAPLTPAQHLEVAQQIAAAAVIADIESGGHTVNVDGMRWIDVRPMLDPREHADACIDMAEIALRYAIDTRVVTQHPQQPHLVRVAQAAG